MSGAATVEWVVQRGRTTLGRVLTRCDATSFTVVDDDAAGPVDVTLTLTPADATALGDGSLRPSVAFMRGQMKMAGDPGALLRVLPVADAEDQRHALGEQLARVVA
jgi:hypothetical protein